MTKALIAYFKTENNAESARAGLQRIKGENLYVDEMPEDDDAGKYIPIMMGTDQEALGGGLNGSSAQEAVVMQQTDDYDFMEDEEDDRPITHMVHVEVNEDDYSEAFQIIHKAKGYLEREKK